MCPLPFPKLDVLLALALLILSVLMQPCSGVPTVNFVCADPVVDCFHYDLDPSNYNEYLLQTALLVHQPHYPGALASIHLWF